VNWYRSCAPIWHSRAAVGAADVELLVEPNTPANQRHDIVQEVLERQHSAKLVDDGFGVIADDLDAIAREFGFSLPDCDNDEESEFDGSAGSHTEGEGNMYEFGGVTQLKATTQSVGVERISSVDVIC
jgi:hypothetical protein